MGSIHLLFLMKRLNDDEPTEYRTIPVFGANFPLPPLGHEAAPTGKTVADQIRSLLKTTAEYNREQYEKDRVFLSKAIE